MIAKGVGGKKDNARKIDRDKDGYRDTQTKILLYINLRVCVCKIYLTFTLTLKQRSKLNIFTPHKELSILT
jgi:hypothetical protein